MMACLGQVCSVRLMVRTQEAREGGTLYASRISYLPGVRARLPEGFGYLDVLIESASCRMRRCARIARCYSRAQWS